MFDAFEEYSKIGNELENGIYDLWDAENYLVVAKAVGENRKLTKSELKNMKLQDYAGEIIEALGLEVD